MNNLKTLWNELVFLLIFIGSRLKSDKKFQSDSKSSHQQSMTVQFPSPLMLMVHLSDMKQLQHLVIESSLRFDEDDFTRWNFIFISKSSTQAAFDICCYESQSNSTSYLDVSIWNNIFSTFHISPVLNFNDSFKHRWIFVVTLKSNFIYPMEFSFSINDSDWITDDEPSSTIEYSTRNVSTRLGIDFNFSMSSFRTSNISDRVDIFQYSKRSNHWLN